MEIVDVFVENFQQQQRQTMDIVEDFACGAKTLKISEDFACFMFSIFNVFLSCFDFFIFPFFHLCFENNSVVRAHAKTGKTRRKFSILKNDDFLCENSMCGPQWTRGWRYYVYIYIYKHVQISCPCATYFAQMSSICLLVTQSALVPFGWDRLQDGGERRDDQDGFAVQL